MVATAKNHNHRLGHTTERSRYSHLAMAHYPLRPGQCRCASSTSSPCILFSSTLDPSRPFPRPRPREPACRVEKYTRLLPRASLRYNLVKSMWSTRQHRYTLHSASDYRLSLMVPSSVSRITFASNRTVYKERLMQLRNSARTNL